MTTLERGLLTPPPEMSVLGLRALKTIAAGGGALQPGARRFLQAAQKIILGVDVDLDALPPITPEALAKGFPDAALRSQIANAFVLVTLVDGAPTKGAAERALAFAAAIGVDEPAFRTIHLFAQGHVLLGKLDWLRRSHIRDLAEGEMHQGVVHGVKAFMGFRGIQEDTMVATPFRALGDLPPGTLGREIFDHYRKHGFNLPGEKHGFPEGAIYHDATHILAGYDTDPLGELQVGAFTAGYRKNHPLFTAMLPLLVFVDNINVTPVPHDEIDHLFSQPDVAEKFITAFERGSRMTVDMSDRWDFWAHAKRPLDDVRNELGMVA